MKTYRFSVVIEKDKEGYFAFCPELQGCYTQADTYEEAIVNIKDAIRLHLEDREESKEERGETWKTSCVNLKKANSQKPATS